MSYSLVLSVFSTASTSVVSKFFQCPLLTALPPSEVLRVKSPLPEAPPPPPKPAIIESVTSNFRLGHKTHHRVAFQSLYTTLSEKSSSDHPRAATCRTKFRPNFPRASRSTRVAPTLFLPPPSDSSFSDLHFW